MRIGVDIDGVIADHYTPFCENTVNDATSAFLAEIPTWDISVPGTDKTILSEIDHLLEDPEYLEQLSTLDGAVEGMSTLAKTDHTVVITTSRPAEVHPTTATWLRDRGIAYDAYAHNVPRNKGLLDIDILLDDYHGYVNDAGAVGTDALLFRRPWNRFYSFGLDASQVVTSWEQAVETILAGFPADT